MYCKIWNRNSGCSWRGGSKAVWMIVLLLALFLCTLPALAHEVKRPAERTIRVAFPIQAGFTSYGPNGEHIGYTCDYLDKVSQYAGWKLEYVTADGSTDEQLETLLGMLQKGEIDLMGAMAHNDSLAEIFDYSSVNYGIANSLLCTSMENTELTSTNFTSYEKLRVAVYSSSQKENETLSKFAQVSGVEVEQVFCSSDEEQLAMVREGKADLVFISDVGVELSGLRTIARFAPRPFYFATAKGNKEIINELNAAIASINEADPYFTTTLHEKYFPLPDQGFFLSDAEKAFLEQAGTLRVALLGGQAPLQYLDPETGEGRGLFPDVLRRISQISGLQFDLVWASTYGQFASVQKEGGADLVSGICYRKSDAGVYRATSTVLSVPVAIAVNSMVAIQELDQKVLALPYGFSYEGTHAGSVVRYDSIEACLDAVERGEADYCSGNSYSIQYYLRANNYKKIVQLPQAAEWAQDYVIGILEPAPVELVSILNKAVKYIPETDLRDFLYKNSYDPGRVTLNTYVHSNPEQVVLLLAMTALTILTVFLMWSRHIEYRNNARRRLENERYVQISELSNEYLFEYDIAKDCLILREKSARLLGCSRVIERLAQKAPPPDCPPAEWLFSRIRTAAEGQAEFFGCLPDGRRRWLRMISKIIRDESGSPTYVVGKFADIHQEKQSQARLQEQASKDSLTGIYNTATARSLITSYLDNGGSGALFILDIDHFKDTNDTYGHLAGDTVLKGLAGILESVFRSDDIVGRLGGDEFVLFMKEVRNEQIVHKKCRAIREGAAKILVEGQPGRVTLSIGVVLTKPGTAFEELYRQADAALYVVKNAGRNGVEIVNS